MLRKVIAVAAAVAFLAIGAGVVVQAKQKPVPPEAKVSLTEAIVAAEQHAKGKAVRAEYEQQKDGRWVYDVKVAAGAARSEVKIDPDKGTVLGARDVTNDDDDEDDERD